MAAFMTASSIFRLLILSTIWGGSFIFMRIAVPALGPVVLMELRVLLAALFLAETVGWHTLAGAFIVILGTALVTGFSPRLLFARKPAAAG